MNCLLGETSIEMQVDYLGTHLTGEAQEWFYRNVEQFDRQVREWTLETVVQGLQKRFLHTLTHHHALTSMDADLSMYPILIPPASNTFYFCHHPQPHHSQPYHTQSIIYHFKSFLQLSEISKSTSLDCNKIRSDGVVRKIICRKCVAIPML